MGKAGPLEHSEDCHFLTIFTPSRTGSRPVLVWIHGGSYVTGSGESSSYDASVLSKEGDIVVVNITYRLGVFGYHYGETPAQRNLGLKDQLTALRWIKENIHHFGGDSSRITLAGQSSGGHSVATLIATCREPLFRKAIIQSAPLSFSRTAEKAEKYAGKLQKLAGKPLENATTEELLNAQSAYLSSSKSNLPFQPAGVNLFGPSAVPSLEEVFLTCQKDDVSPLARWLPLPLATLASRFLFISPAKRYAKKLKKEGIRAHLEVFDWRPEGSPLGACHCLELALLFGDWERWKESAMLGNTSKEEWEDRGKALRRRWIDFVKK